MFVFIENIWDDKKHMRQYAFKKKGGEFRTQTHTEGRPREDRGVSIAKERGSGEISPANTVTSMFEPPDSEK